MWTTVFVKYLIPIFFGLTLVNGFYPIRSLAYRRSYSHEYRHSNGFIPKLFCHETDKSNEKILSGSQLQTFKKSIILLTVIGSLGLFNVNDVYAVTGAEPKMEFFRGDDTDKVIMIVYNVCTICNKTCL